MRNWASVFGIVGGAASALFWAFVPLGSRGSYVPGGFEPLYIVFVILSLGGLAGGLVAGRSNRFAPALMALAVIPGIGALFLPGLLLTIGGLLSLNPVSDQPKLAH